METMAVESQKLYIPLMSKIIKAEQLTPTEKRFEILLPKFAKSSNGLQPVGLNFWIFCMKSL